MDTKVSLTMQPVSQNERIQILDILRGFAIFGILVVNILGFASPRWLPGYPVSEGQPWYDTLASYLVIFLAEGKFYSTFSFLFGLGFSVQLARAEARGTDIRSFYPRRLWVLFGIGILHALLFWTGDILRVYALLGFALLAFRTRANRTLLVWTGAFFTVSLLILTLMGGPGASSEAIPGIDLLAIARETYTRSSILSVLIFQAIELPFSFLLILLGQGPSVMALFLLGLLAGRQRLFNDIEKNHRAFKRLLWVGLLLGVAGHSLFLLTENGFLLSLGFTVGAPALAAFYVSGLSLLSQPDWGRRLLAPLANVGRMALSNYVLQSIVCSLIFNGYGLGLYEKVGDAGLLGIAITIYLVQIPLSAWWLQRFYFGPLEWLWRSLTYGKRQPFRRD
ncbi:MAG: DUF418 domain-containing protein [Chloroflexota bacterium]